MIKVLIADDQHLIRAALSALLELEEDIEVVGEVGRGDEVVEAVERLKPDIAMLDIEMPGMDGLSTAAALMNLASPVKILVLTTFGRPGYLKRAMEAGVLGFVVKDAPPDQLADAVRKVARGERVVDPNLAISTLSLGDNPLSNREIDVLSVAKDGATVNEIAHKLALSEGTVRNYLSSAIAKTSSRNRVEAVKFAEQQGWL